MLTSVHLGADSAEQYKDPADFTCGGGSCKPKSGSGAADLTRRLHKALWAAADATGLAKTAYLQLLSERALNTIGPATAKLVTQLASRLPGADQNPTLALFAKIAGAPTPPVALVAENIAGLVFALEKVPAGTYGGTTGKKSYRKYWVVGGVLAAGAGGVYLWRRYR